MTAPGSLVEQWQDELWRKFRLEFDILTRDVAEASRTGNPFQERRRLVARLDHLARNEDGPQSERVATPIGAVRRWSRIPARERARCATVPVSGTPTPAGLALYC